MRDTRRVSLGQTGLDFVLEHLSAGNVLSDELRLHVLATPGEAWTCIPTDAPDETAFAFEAGGLLPENLDFSRATDIGDGFILPVAS
ncbi:MAG TPA: hypothetical protein VD929_05775 [Caulobacteraceae bacterium]|nr:hypothetical protein [Caulobacteraceae bacterium]